jgi:hypothetical protein
MQSNPHYGSNQDLRYVKEYFLKITFLNMRNATGGVTYLQHLHADITMSMNG